MWYAILFYISDLSSRFKKMAEYSLWISAAVGAVLLLSLIGHTQPTYYLTVLNILWYVKWIAIISAIALILPSEKTCWLMIGIKYGNEILSNSLLANAIHLAKLKIKINLFKQVVDTKINDEGSLYNNLISSGLIKFSYVCIYVYDLWNTYKSYFNYAIYAFVAYVAFIISSWSYITFFNGQMYYSNFIHEHAGIAVGIIIFIATKVILLPKSNTLKLMLLSIVYDYVSKRPSLVKLSNYVVTELAKYKDDEAVVKP